MPRNIQNTAKQEEPEEIQAGEIPWQSLEKRPRRNPLLAAHRYYRTGEYILMEFGLDLREKSEGGGEGQTKK
ncbi:hypothetical protein EYF80_032136 [Liparis tanakae]|uniref:Uncharacterized protein n=1 Tax=Liparis tanakae TaxID=230148 RepID=A0A4Z2GYI6_9TELE|nr:hypothetical protein EYF80_032136 [Liparis tanakae]